MNYEELYAAYQAQDKEISDLMKNQNRLVKRIEKFMEVGDLKSAAKDLAQLTETSAQANRAAEALRGTVEGFDAQAYMESGAYAEQMLEYFRRAHVDARGEGTSYEVFPWRLRIDAENMDIYIDRKRVPCARPAWLVEDLRARRDKLLAGAFNPGQFASELAAAYDLLILIQGKNKQVAAEPDLYLTQLYKQMTPMRRARREYDAQAFAFDLARLYSSDLEQIDDGRRFQFGPSRDIRQAIRVLDREGNEQYLATIRFYQA